MSRSDKLRLLFYVYPVNRCFYVSCIPYPISPVFWEDTRVGYYGFEINRDNKSNLYVSEVETVFPKKPNNKLKNKQYFLSSTIRAGSLSEAKWFVDLFSKINFNIVKKSEFESYIHMNYSYSIISSILEYTMISSVSSIRSISPIFHHFYSPAGTKYLSKEIELGITVDDFINLENKIKEVLYDNVIFQDTKSMLIKMWHNHLEKEI